MKKSKGKISRRFKDEVFRVKVWVLAGYSPSEAYETINRKEKINISMEDFEMNKGMQILLKDKKDEMYHIIWLEKRTDFYNLMHECIHLVKDVFVPMGIPFDHTNDELIAYYQEYWFKRIWKAVGKNE